METPRYPRVTLPVLIRDSIVRFCHVDGNRKTDADEAAFAPGPGYR